MKRPNQYLLATDKGLYVAEALLDSHGKATLKLCPSDAGDGPHSPFAFYDMRISAIAEVSPDRLLLTARGRTRLYGVDLSTRAAVDHIENPSGAITQFCMLKHPKYDAEKCPYIFLKDSKFVSVVDVKMKKTLPILRSQLDLEQLNFNNFAVQLVPNSDMVAIYTLECRKENGAFRSDLNKYLLDMEKIAGVMEKM